MRALRSAVRAAMSAGEPEGSEVVTRRQKEGGSRVNAISLELEVGKVGSHEKEEERGARSQLQVAAEMPSIRRNRSV